jgi:RNA polymerase sigma-70 factor (ECF subfamily)
MNFFKRKATFDPTDHDSVLSACLGGDQQAQRALIKLYFGYVKSIALRYVNNPMDVEEIINDSFLKVFTNLKLYDPSQPFKAWLRTIVVRTSIDYFRRDMKLGYLDDIEKIAVVDDSHDVLDTMSGEEIMKLVHQLSPVYRMVFTMYVIDGYSHREIADMLGIKEGTSKSNLQDARRRLQALIRNENPNVYYLYEYKNKKTYEN